MNNTKIYIWWGWCDDVYIFKSIFFKKKFSFYLFIEEKKMRVSPMCVVIILFILIQRNMYLNVQPTTTCILSYHILITNLYIIHVVCMHIKQDL